MAFIIADDTVHWILIAEFWIKCHLMRMVGNVVWLLSCCDRGNLVAMIAELIYAEVKLLQSELSRLISAKSSPEYAI